ncbi:MAG: 4-hydroxy-tetrahydrodipicolinate synthase [Anaerolineae bacterium]|nr:4-hydroxy-tetrahydrodipicolinate synthase [Anaerolineae bacterium]
MLTADALRGVIPAIVTPFTVSDAVDEPALRRITDHVLRNGVHGVMTTGGTGEFPHLSREEKRIVTAIVVDEVQGRVPVIAGTAACSTREAIDLSEDAQAIGADAVIVTAPYYFGLPPSSLERHYRELAEAVDIPIVVYNNPLYTGNNLSPALLARLAEVEGIIGLKQSNDNLGELVEVVRLARERMSVCTGIDSQFYPALCVGARGIFSTAANVMPAQMVQVYELTVSGRHDEARELHLRLQVLNRLLEYDPGYVSPCKEALAMMGMPAGRVRRPLPELTDEEWQELRGALEQLGLV